jgi:hypothetical protein
LIGIPITGHEGLKHLALLPLISEPIKKVFLLIACPEAIIPGLAPYFNGFFSEVVPFSSNSTVSEENGLERWDIPGKVTKLSQFPSVCSVTRKDSDFSFSLC